jgi:uncharacterized Ntn-hydrolase superfamily protein
MNLKPSHLFSTYSIVARDPASGNLGIAVQTHQMGVGRVVPWLLPGIGAMATQALANISLGPIALTLLAEGVPAPRVVEALVASDENAHRRQFAVVDASGEAAAWTGQNCIPEAQHHTGQGYSVQANMMTQATVVPAMVEAFESTSGDLAQRMLAALQAAQAEGGDIRGMQSAALKVVPGDAHQPAWATTYDLRVDEHDQPVDELARLVRLRHAQLIDAEGYELLEAGQRADALAKWAAARAEAPELEELPFWQAVTLADNHANVETAAAILGPVLANEPHREHWLDLIDRLQTCGLLDRADTARELRAALG